MGMVARRQRIASAYFVIFGKYGDVGRYAEQRGVCRQWIYREAHWLEDSLAQKQARIEALEQRVEELEQKCARLEERLAVSVVVDEDMQGQLASVGQANGVSLPIVWEFLEVMLPGKHLSVASLGRRSQTAGKKSGELLPIFDEFSQPRVRDAAADELYVNDPLRMVVEQESLCWLSGRLVDKVDGEGWAEEFRLLPNLEQLARDGGKALQKGVALVNASRQEQGQAPVVDQGDHFHALRGAGIGLARLERQAANTLAKAEQAQHELEECKKGGVPATGAGRRASVAWTLPCILT